MFLPLPQDILAGILISTSLESETATRKAGDKTRVYTFYISPLRAVDTLGG